MLSDEMLSIYEIAFHLKMPIYKLAEEMPYEELLGWFDYLERRPFEWRADDRAAKLLQAQGVKEKPQNLFSSLIAIYKPRREEKPADTVDLSFKNSLMFQKMMTARGGDKLDL
jgi:hypothetical protein